MLERFAEGQKTSIQQMVMSSKQKNWICSPETDDVECAKMMLNVHF
jgi:hypothetical protein